MNSEPVGIYGPQPANRTDDGVPHERTGLAWQRTAIASMVAGVAFTRVLSSEGHPALGLIGIVWVLAGGALLAWAASNDTMLRDPLRPAAAVPQVALTRAVGLSTTALALVSLITAVALTLR